MTASLTFDKDGYAPFTADDGETWLAFLHAGLRVTGWPVTEVDGAALLLRPGADDPAFEPEALLTFINRDQLAAFIADLTALHAQITENRKD